MNFLKILKISLENPHYSIWKKKKKTNAKVTSDL